MMRSRFAVLAGATIALVLAARTTAAAPVPKATQPADPWAVLSAKLGLNKQQQEQIRQVDDTFRAKVAEPRQQLLRLRQEEHEAVQRVLTDAQRAKLPQALHDLWDREWRAAAVKLKLSDQQQQQIAKIRQEYADKFRSLSPQAASNPEKYHELRAGFFDTVDKVLNDQQRAQFADVLHQEFGQWQNKEFRQQHLKALADALGLSEAQRQQIKKIHEAYAPKLQQPTEQLERLHDEEYQAVEKLLTPDQRTKLRQFLESDGGERTAQPGRD